MIQETLQKVKNYFLKPSSCEGCPFYNYGAYYTPDYIVPSSKVMFLAQNPGEQEEAGRRLVQRLYDAFGKWHDEYEVTVPQPLIGPTGKQFTDRFLPLSGLTRGEVSLGNVIRCRPGKALGKEANWLPPITATMKLEHSKADIVNALKHCQQAHFHPPKSTELVVTMGRHAMFALTGIQHEDTEYKQKIGVMESWRGYGVDVPNYRALNTINTSVYHPYKSTRKVFFTTHIAALWQGEKNKRFFHATLLDFAKIGQILRKEWPLELPIWSNELPAKWPKYSCFDTEFDPYNQNKLIMWSLCDNAYNIYVVYADQTPSAGIPIEPESSVLMQNVWADIGHIRNIVDVSQIKLEDMMLADSVLWTGEPHTLNFIQSKHGSLNKYKHLSDSNPDLYSACDAHQPMYIWRNHFIPSFKKDLLSWRIYKEERLKLINMIDRAHRAGSAISGERLREVQQTLTERTEAYQQEARELTGNPEFNLGGRKYMQEVMYD